MLPPQLLIGLPYLPLRIYPTEQWKILSHVVLTPNMDWNPIIINSTEAKYAKYDEWLGTTGLWDNTTEHVVYTSKVLTGATQYLLFRSNRFSTE